MWIDKKGYSSNILATESELASKGTQIEVVRFFKGKYKHFHKVKTETFYFLKGKGSLILNGKQIDIFPEKLIVIPPNSIHEWINDSDEPMEAVILKTNNTPEDTYTKF